MAISLVGGVWDETSSTGVSTFTVNAVNAGDVWILTAHVFGASTPALSGVSGGGAAQWFRGCYAADPNTGTGGSTLEMWWGKITTAGSGQTVNLTWSPANGSNFTEVTLQEFAGSGPSTVWTQVASSAAAAGATSATLTPGTLTSTAAGQLAWFHFDPGQSITLGTAAGFTYSQTTFGLGFAINLNTAAGTGYAPTCTQSSAAHYITAGLILNAGGVPASGASTAAAHGTAVGKVSFAETGVTSSVTAHGAATATVTAAGTSSAAGHATAAGAATAVPAVTASGSGAATAHPGMAAAAVGTGDLYTDTYADSYGHPFILTAAGAGIAAGVAVTSIAVPAGPGAGHAVAAGTATAVIPFTGTVTASSTATAAGTGFASVSFPVAPPILPPALPPPVPPTVAADTLELYRALGPIPALTDTVGQADADLGWPLLRILDGVGQILQRVDDITRDDPATGAPGWSILFDPARCPTYALPWLAQMVGVRFDTTTATDTAQRAAIRAEQGFQRGTRAAMQAAAAKWLAPGQTITIFERTPDPYSLTVLLSLQQLAAGPYWQTEDEFPTYAARSAARSAYSTAAYPQAQIEAAIVSQKPAGLTMTIQVVTSATYQRVGAAFSTYASRSAALPTYADVTVWQP